MDTNGLTELSGLYWNSATNRLYVTHGDGRLRVLQLNTVTNTFSQLASRTLIGGPEGITQVNNGVNEFYTIDEDNYLIRKYTHPANFSSVTLSKTWNIVAAPSTMTNTGNTGPEGIAFVPDSFLTAGGFISQVTGNAYTSVKGMGGLIFIAHQDQGRIWVFDINPNTSNDFAFVGKYKTNKTESCEIAFDRSTGLLYTLHNTGVNTLEVTSLSSTPVAGGERKFNTYIEYTLGNPSGNINVEGFAINSKCTDSTNVSVWLCRDVESNESINYKKDCLRWFNPFAAPGSCPYTLPITLNLKLFMEGYYAGNGTMQPVLFNNGLSNDATACDSVTVQLRQAVSPHALFETKKGLLHTDGTIQVSFSNQSFNHSYYLAVKHRNSLEVWSKNTVLFNAATIVFDFTH